MGQRFIYCRCWEAFWKGNHPFEMKWRCHLICPWLFNVRDYSSRTWLRHAGKSFLCFAKDRGGVGSYVCMSEDWGGCHDAVKPWRCSVCCHTFVVPFSKNHGGRFLPRRPNKKKKKKKKVTKTGRFSDNDHHVCKGNVLWGWGERDDKEESMHWWQQRVWTGSIRTLLRAENWGNIHQFQEMIGRWNLQIQVVVSSAANDGWKTGWRKGEVGVAKVRVGGMQGKGRTAGYLHLQTHGIW